MNNNFRCKTSLGSLLVRFGTAFLLAGAVLSTSALAQERTMIVLDGSGSMWGQIDGVPKLTIARETLREVLRGVPASTELGLMSYGHREKGNCDDIEIIVPPAPGTAPLISDKVDSLNFLGKTPLGEAVQIAAREMRFTEDKSTVILITDGIETCGADISSIASALESQGVDFTVHVVGFGLSKDEGDQVSDLATITGGRFFLADDANSLVTALNEVVVEVVAEVGVTPTPETTLFASDQDENIVDDIPLNWEVRDEAGAVVAKSGGSNTLAGQFEAGSYYVVVSGEGVSGGFGFVIEEDAGAQTIYVPVVRFTLSANLEAPDEVAVGAQFVVTWEGPNDASDFVTIVEIGAREGGFGNYAYTNNGNPSTVTALESAGVYELRYVHGPTDKTLATREIRVVDVLAELLAPDFIAAGAEFDVIWTGPDNQGDFVTIVELGADEGEFADYAYTQNGTPARLIAPDGLGTYEIRYVMSQSERTLASRQITVTAVSGTLEAPKSVAAGSEFEVIWTGPANKGDFITIVEKGAEVGDFLDYAYAVNGSPSKITAPDGLGAYEIRYVFGTSDRTIVSADIELTAVFGTLVIENNPVPGGSITVSWTGPANNRDYITIVEVGTPEGKFTDFDYTRRGSPVTFDVPRALGAFEVRYVLGQSKRTLVSLPVILRPATAEISAPGNIATGAAFEVTWTGPGNREDFIEIVEAGAEANASPVSDARTVQGSPLALFAPGSAGSYEVRYKMRDTGEVLASAALNVQ